ncbi:hypothetical protein K504DRAFT_463822, partial [Pleomassaria siparia CBS 279.74]
RSISNVPLGEEYLAQWVDFSRFFAEYDFTIKDKAWRSKIVQWNEQDTIIIGTTAGGDELAGDIHEWALAFDVGSSGKNVVSVTNFLLTKMKASHPYAPDNKDTNDSPFVLIYPDVIVIN